MEEIILIGNVKLERRIVVGIILALIGFAYTIYLLRCVLAAASEFYQLKGNVIGVTLVLGLETIFATITIHTF
jgi:hypothetical protein